MLAISEPAGLAPAACALGVSHATVLRRISAAEAAYGVYLFQHLPSGYELTTEGDATLLAVRHLFSMSGQSSVGHVKSVSHGALSEP